FDGGDDVAPEFGEADLADECVALFYLNHPIAKSHQYPMAGVAQDLRPGFLARERLAADMPRDDRICPHRPAGVEILQPVSAHSQAVRLDRRGRSSWQFELWHELTPPEIPDAAPCRAR